MPKTIFRKEKTSQVKQLGPNGQWPNHLVCLPCLLSCVLTCVLLCVLSCVLTCFSVCFQWNCGTFFDGWWTLQLDPGEPQTKIEHSFETPICLRTDIKITSCRHIYIYICSAMLCCAMWIVSCKMATIHSNFSQLFWIRRPIETNYSGIHFLRLRNKNDCT